MNAVSQNTALEKARTGVRRAVLRRDLRALADGKRNQISIDLDDPELDAPSAVMDVARRLSCDSAPLLRLMAACRNSGIADAAVDRLLARGIGGRRQGARLLGALRMPQAVDWLAPLVVSKNRAVSEAAARALGRIGGQPSAQVLLVAIRRTGPRRTLIVELARAAPDLFLEVTLSEAKHPLIKQAAAIAAGLRRRRAAVRPLLTLLATGGRRERAASCRALGWIGSQAAIPSVTAALDDPEWKVRLAATKAVRDLRASMNYPTAHRLLNDPHPSVRRAARIVVKRMLREERPRWR